MKKRILSVLLSVAMALSLLPMAVWATGDDSATSESAAKVYVGGKNMAIGETGDTVYMPYSADPFVEGTTNTTVPTDNYAKLHVIGEIAYLTLHDYGPQEDSGAASVAETDVTTAISAENCELVVILEGSNHLTGYNNGISVSADLTITTNGKEAGYLYVTGSKSEEENGASQADASEVPVVGLFTQGYLTIQNGAQVDITLCDNAMIAGDGESIMISGEKTNVDATGDVHVACSDVCVMGGTLTMRGEAGKLLAQGCDLISFGPSWYRTSPSDGAQLQKCEDGVIPVNVMGEDDYIEVTMTSPSNVGLWVGGVPVVTGDTGNASDILGGKDTNATATFNASTNTLTLSNYTNEGLYSDFNAAIYYEGSKALNIELVGSNTIMQAGYAIVSRNADVNIAEAQSAAAGSAFLFIIDSLFGITTMGDGDVTFVNGYVYAESAMNAVYVEDGNIAINGGTLLANSYSGMGGAFSEAPAVDQASDYWWLENAEAGDSNKFVAFDADTGDNPFVYKDQSFVYVTYTNPYPSVTEGTNLWVGGVAVTTGNASDILGDKDGTGATASFANGVLTLNNYTNKGYYVPEGSDGMGATAIYYTGSNPLTIKLEGNNVINGADFAVLSTGVASTSNGDVPSPTGGDLTFTGNGSLMIINGTFGVAANGGDVTFGAEPETAIEPADEGTPAVKGTIFIEAEGMAVSAKNIKVNNTIGTLLAHSYGDFGLNTLYGPVEIDSGLYWTVDEKKDAEMTSDDHKYPTTGNHPFVYVTSEDPNPENSDGGSDATTYLWVGGEAVDDDVQASANKNYTYDEDTNTLTLTNYTDAASYGMGEAAILYTGSEDLNIVLEGYNTLLGGGYGILNDSTDVIIFGNGSLMIPNALFGIATVAKEDGTEGNGDVIINSGNLFVEASMGAIYAGGGDVKVKGGSLMAHTYGQLGGKELPAIHAGYVNGGAEGVHYWWTNNPEATSYYTSSEKDLTVNTLASSSFLYVTYDNPYKDYGIWVGDTPITGETINKLPAGVSYSPTSNTLILNGYAGTSLCKIGDPVNGPTAGIYVDQYTIKPLTIQVTGTNSIPKADYGILSTSDTGIVFTGSGSLTTGANFFGTCVLGGDVTVNGPTVTSEGDIVGVYTSGNTVTFTSGKLVAQGANAVDAAEVTIGSAQWRTDAEGSFQTTAFAYNPTDSYVEFVAYSGGGSSGGGGSSSYSVTTPATSNGSVTVSPSSAKKGDTVTVTPEADQGYVVDTVTVKDKDGKAVATTKNADGTYSFTMPAGKVTVEVTFKAETPTGTGFTDVPAGAYYAAPVAWAVEEGITNGMTETTFGPESFCTRAHIVTFLWRAHGSPAPSSSVNPFTDLDEDQYYMDAVLWAVEKGITNGMTATTFGPDLTCTRSQALTFMWRADGQPNSTAANPFVDVSAGAYYENAVLWGVGEEITNGTSATTFSPEDTCTRGQIVTFLYRDLAQ